MKKFMNDDFLLHTETACKLYHDAAKNMPIFDYHNHLDASEILQDFCFDNITDAWLKHDHYKWRAMRAYGISEELITGKADPFEKFMAYVKTICACVGNPLYHWTHLELKNYFGITEALNEKNAREIYDKCNEMLKDKKYSVRNLLKMQNVKALCTTDDPIDSLESHRKLSVEFPEIKVLPSYRPDQILYPEKENFKDYVGKLEKASGMKITDMESLCKALHARLVFFKECGCLVSDHSLEGAFYLATDENEANDIFAKRMEQQVLTDEETVKLRTFLMLKLAKMYYDEDIVMQIHIGALRDNSYVLKQTVGANAGCDSINDAGCAKMLSDLLNNIQQSGLPKTILYHLNPAENEMLATMCGNFQSNGGRSRVQWGPAWWLNDQKRGMEEQIEVYARQGVLGNHPGMLTDSRSFLSFPRHEYFRRILCNKLGEWVENGEYPCDMEYLSSMVENICYNNAAQYFNLEAK